MKAGVRFFVLISGLLLAGPCLAQANVIITPPPADLAPPAMVQVGAVVHDSAGGSAGRVLAVDGDKITVATHKSRFVMPISAFRLRSGGLALTLSEAEIDALVARRTRPLSAQAMSK